MEHKLHMLQNKTDKQEAFRHRLESICADLIDNDMVPEIIGLCSTLQDNNVARFIHQILVHVTQAVRIKIKNLWNDIVHTKSEALETKDRNMQSYDMYEDTQKSLASYLPSRSTIKRTCNIWNDRVSRLFDIRSRESEAYECDLAMIVRLFIYSTLLDDPKLRPSRFLFKISLDGRPFHEHGQTGLSITPLNCSTFPTQNPRSVIYMALWSGKENYDLIKRYCSSITQQLHQFIQDKTILVNGERFQIDFIWTSDWSAWKNTIDLSNNDCNNDEFCFFCDLSRKQLRPGKQGNISTRINFFGFDCDHTGICNLHAIQRITESQLLALFRTRSSEADGFLTQDDFQRILQKYIPDFKFKSKEHSIIPDKDVKVCFVIAIS
jgi:hypothetical protein